MLPSPIDCGKTVAFAVTTAPPLAPSVDQASPCRASTPVLKGAMPSRGIAGWNWCSIAIFSSSVSRASRSSTRASTDRLGSRNG